MVGRGDSSEAACVDTPATHQFTGACDPQPCGWLV